MSSFTSNSEPPQGDKRFHGSRWYTLALLVLVGAGLLLVEVNTVEEKGGTLFVGVDAGFNLSNLHAYYQYPYIVTALVERDSPLAQVTIAGNINEGIDTLAEDIPLPLPQEGDLLAIMNLGGYSSSNSSNHCMRGDYQEFVLVSD